MRKIRLFLLLISLFGGLIANGQINVSGVIFDGYNEGVMPGVNVIEKGTNNGTISNFDGKFSIKVANANSVLVFSFIGYVSQEVTVGNQTNISVKLKMDDKMIEDVVVVGYGTQKKSDVTGSVTSVDKERFTKLPVNNVLQAVQGVAAGVTVTQESSIPGDAPAVMVRGQNSIKANTTPYIVVDGIPISKSGGSLKDINPNDIESMEILKDASAVAIYGTNGANGVILITTKRGALGKPTIRYNGYVGFDNIAKKYEMRSGEEYVQKYADYLAQRGEEQTSPVPNYGELDNYNAGITRDWLDDVSRTGIIQDHNVSVSGGTDNLKYYVSGDYLQQKGVLDGYQYKRYSFRTNIEMNVTDYLTIGTNSYTTVHNSDGGRVDMLMASAMSPYAEKYEEDGSYKIYPMYPELLFTSPYLHVNDDVERRNFNINVNGNAVIDFGKILKPLEGLSYKFNIGYNYLPERVSSYVGRSANDKSGTAYIENKETQSYTAENILTFSRDFNLHHIDLTALYSAQNKKFTESKATSVGFINDELAFNNIDAGTTQSAASNSNEYGTLSQMGRINYSFDSRYLFTFTVRRDGSSVFGANTDKYGTFPSVALGWNLHRENFMQSLAVINNLKIRGSYGKSGNEAIEVYKTITTSKSVRMVADGTGVVGMISDVLGNSDLTWETTTGFNVGIDFGILSDRISGTLDFYKNTTEDILLERSLPNISGYTKTFINIGETENTGFEFTLNTKNVVTDNFSWETAIVYSRNKNELIDLYGDGSDDIGNKWFLGEPIGVIYDYEKLGIWQVDEIEAGAHLDSDPTAVAGDVKFKDLNGDNKITADKDKKVLGQKAPKWTGGITNSFRYKNWNMSIFIQTVQGGLKSNGEVQFVDESGRRNTPVDVKYWTAENRNNEFPSLTYVNSRGYSYPYKHNYTRIKDITLSYTVPESALSKMKIGGLTLYASGRNLYTFTDWIGWDPEARYVMRGSENSTINYPNVRSIVFGINLTL